MLFIVDGYNVTRSDPATCDLSLEAQREALVARLRARGDSMLGRGRIVVVFDGAEGAGVSHAAGIPVETRYSRDSSADDEIVRLATASVEPLCLVTSDNGLIDRVRTHSAVAVETRSRDVAFEASGRGSSRKGGRGRTRRDTGIPSGANKITEELKKLWLD
ncbi:MAG: NYN domain-containing protein [Actinomycetota bacterium]|jgi:predicted RNA-binding protein with PIN domain|nr:NYN domain-containing protein [Actinomycetota bacterium]